MTEKFDHEMDSSNEKKIECTHGQPVFITGSPIMTDLIRKIKLVAKTNATLLLTGENGTGKEVLARMVHYHSDRSKSPFVAVNCGAIPNDLVETELFGYEKGAFTGATNKKPGCFEIADKGILFLDEIGDMPHSAQVKLLRAVELSSFRRVGGKEEINVDVGLISATNKILIDQVKSGSFREDLFYRLNVIELNIPPLRHRREDIPLLISYYSDYFYKKYQLEPLEFSKECMDLFMSYDWPGNVRELKNVVERSYVLIGGGGIVEPWILPASVQKIDKSFLKIPVSNSNHSNEFIQIPIGMSFKDIEQTVIDRTLDSVNDNKTEAAKILGFSRKTLHNKLDKYTREKHKAAD